MLGHPGDEPPPRVEPARRQVGVANADPAAGRRQQPEQQRRDRALAGAALADERHGLAGRELQVRTRRAPGRYGTDTRTTPARGHRRPRGARREPRAAAARPPPAHRAARTSARPRPARRRSRGTRRRAGGTADTARVRARSRSAPPAARGCRRRAGRRPSPRPARRPIVAASSSTEPDRKLIRSVSIVVWRYRSLTSPTTAASSGRGRRPAASAARARRRGSGSRARAAPATAPASCPRCRCRSAT